MSEPELLQVWEREGLTISTDPSRLDMDVIHRFLCFESYWAKGRPRVVNECVVANSLPFGVYDGASLIGFARVVTDYGAYGYIADVFILDAYRGRGLGKWLMECVLAHPALQQLKRWHLATADAHGLYQQFGFVRPPEPMRHMERVNPDPYGALSE